MSDPKFILEDTEEPTLPSIGQVLKETREQQHLSVEDVAGKLNLRVSIVKALEEDDHDVGLPKPYVIGYIKNYIRFLQIEPSALKSQLASLTAQNENTKQAHRTDDVYTNEKSDALNLKLIGIGAIALLIILLFTFKSNVFSSGTDSSSQSQQIVE